MESRASNADLVHTQKRPMWPPGASCTQRVVSESACLVKAGDHVVIYTEAAVARALNATNSLPHTTKQVREPAC